MKCYKIKTGDRWITRSGSTLDPSKARVFSKLSHAKSSIKVHRYDAEIIEFEVLPDQEGWVSVQLPSGDFALQDYLEERGYLEAANKLRGS